MFKLVSWRVGMHEVNSEYGLIVRSKMLLYSIIMVMLFMTEMSLVVVFLKRT